MTITQSYQVNEKGYYGDFGGAYIPEMLYPNVEELRSQYLKIMDDADFKAEFKKLLKDYQETGDLLFKLGNEIKSQPLPKNLREKVEILKSWKKPIKQEFRSFNFFGLFKVQYAGIAAAFCLFFVGGFYTNTYMASLDDGKTAVYRRSPPTIILKRKVDRPILKPFKIILT